MVESVRERLVRLREIYEGLLELAREKQPVLQANKDYEAVRAFTERESALINEAAQVERERLVDVQALAAEWGQEPEKLTVYEIANRAGGQAGSELKQAADELAKVIKELQRQNGLNRQLIEINLSFASYMLDALVRQENPSNIYGATGFEIEDENRRPILDSEI